MMQLAFNMIDYLKGRKLKCAYYGITFVIWLIIFALLKLVFEL